MSYQTETTNVSAQFINQNFVRKLDEGRIKEAAAAGSAFIRAKMREQAFVREILTPVLLTDDEIDRDENTDQPKKIVEKEPDSTATFVNFRGTGPSSYFHGDRYAVYFGKVESQRQNKSKFELMSYQNDIRKILSDNSVKDMADEEDLKWLELCRQIIAGIVPPAPSQEITAGAFGPDQIKLGLQNLVSRRLPIGKMLMTKALFYEAVSLNQATVGDDILARHYDDGVESESRLWGIPVVTTIKSDIFEKVFPGKADKTIMLYAPEQYLGNFFMLQDATLFIEQKADMIKFWSYEALGIGVGNTGGMVQINIL